MGIYGMCDIRCGIGDKVSGFSPPHDRRVNSPEADKCSVLVSLWLIQVSGKDQ
jgi:hypothetical protein